jgi:rhamnogalacturonan endolyase
MMRKALVFAIGLMAGTLLHAATTPASTVTVTEDDATFTLANGIITASVSKRSGDLTSLQYKGREVLTDKSGHPGGYWSDDTTGGRETIARITIDPKSNGGGRAEVSVRGISGGRRMGHGPGSGPEGDIPADIEIRYCLGRGESGVYTYCTFDHLPEYGGASMTEARYCAKLADTFDYMNIDDRRSMPFPATLHEGDKYIYTAGQYDHPAYGWTSTREKIGFFFLNPTVEYLSGGPTKTEFLCHRDTTQVAAPCVENYRRSSHYGGAAVDVGPGEHWTKVIGPFFIYVNSGTDQKAMFKDALARAGEEAGKWPYEWVAGIDYPHRDARATVSGRLVLNDPLMPGARMTRPMVGLAFPAYPSPFIRPGATNAPRREIDWQTDAKHYEFWVRGEDNGRFRIPNVRPGKYTLHAFADGVLGEFARTDIVVEAGKSLDLGRLSWQPVRRGRQLWEIGVPNREASEFMNGSKYYEPDASLQYVKLFPNDVNYIVGRSDYRKDWYFQQVPHSTDADARPEPFFGVRSNGRATPFAISFNLPGAPHGKATLRVAICGTGAHLIEVSVNDKPAGRIDRLIGDGTITRHGNHGIWYERELAFDASMMKQGANVLELTVPAGPVNNGIMYDYLRLELDENARVVAGR